MTPPPEPPGDASGPRGPERPWSAAPVDADDPLLLTRLGLVVPDDARELDALRRRVRREERRRSRDVADPATGRAAATGIAVSALLLACTVALTGTLSALISPGPPLRQATGLPLARTVEAVGEPGGLLPDAGALLDGDTGIALRTLRPSVLLVPRPAPADPCPECGDVLADLGAQAAEYGMGVYVVVPPADAARGRTLVAAAGTRNVRLVVDGSGSVEAAFAGSVDRLVFVHADGVVAGVRARPNAQERLEPALVRLPQPSVASDLRPSPLGD